MSEDQFDWMLSKETLALLDRVSIGAFIKNVLASSYPLVTRKLLLIRHNLPDTVDPATGQPMQELTQITHKAGGQAKARALAEGWEVDDLAGNNATRANILSALEKQPDFILYYGHCCGTGCANLCAQENDQLKPVLGLYAGPGGTSNLQLLSAISASAVTCLTAQQMGPAAVQAGMRAYLGYTDYFKVITSSLPVPGFVLDIQDEFIEAANAANIALLEGMTYEVAFQKGREAWDQKWQKYAQQCAGNLTPSGQKLCPMLPAILLHNKQKLDRLGNPKAVARPIGIVLTT